MGSQNRTATAAGVFFLITEFSAIAGLVLYQPALSEAHYVNGPGSDTRVLLGVLSELVLIAAIIGTAATLYPVVRAHGESIAAGYVMSRLLEAVIIAVGMISVLTIVTMRQEGVDEGALAVGQALAAVHDWAFLIGPSVVLGMNSLLLAYLMLRSGLVPRWIAVVGLIGGPLVAASAVAVIMGAYGPTTHAVSALPVFAWEISLAVYLIAKGFVTKPPAGAGAAESRAVFRPSVA